MRVNIFCQIGIHKWSNYKEKFGIDNNRGYKPFGEVFIPVRICKNCSKKQRYVYIQNVWTDADLTKEENREKLLKNLLNE